MSTGNSNLTDKETKSVSNNSNKDVLDLIKSSLNSITTMFGNIFRKVPENVYYDPHGTGNKNGSNDWMRYAIWVLLFLIFVCVLLFGFGVFNKNKKK